MEPIKIAVLSVTNKPPAIQQAFESYLNAAILACDYETVVHIVRDDQAEEGKREWNEENVWRVATLKNMLVTGTLMRNPAITHYFLIDSDVLVHPQVLNHLVGQDKDIITQVFWTDWQDNGDQWPNVWSRDHYTFDPGVSEMLQYQGVYPIGMLGACTLIKRAVWEAGVGFHKVPNLSLWGEDRHFCVRAACAGFGLYCSTVLPALHLYRDSDLERIAKFDEECEEVTL